MTQPDGNLRAAQMAMQMVQEALAQPPRPSAHEFVRDYLAARPFMWVPASEVADASGGRFTVATVGAEMGALHDYGLATTIGAVGAPGRRARWDAG